MLVVVAVLLVLIFLVVQFGDEGREWVKGILMFAGVVALIVAAGFLALVVYALATMTHY